MLHGIRAPLPAEREVVVIANELARRAHEPHDLQHHLLGARRPPAELAEPFPGRDVDGRTDDGLQPLLPLRPGAVLKRPMGAVAIRGFQLLCDDEHPRLVDPEADRAVVVPDVTKRLAGENPNAMVPRLRGRE